MNDDDPIMSPVETQKASIDALSVTGCWVRRATPMGEERPTVLRPTPPEPVAYTDGFHLWDEKADVKCARCGKTGPGFVRRFDGEERCSPHGLRDPENKP